jgi:hypothetical protein
MMITIFVTEAEFAEIQALQAAYDNNPADRKATLALIDRVEQIAGRKLQGHKIEVKIDRRKHG